MDYKFAITESTCDMQDSPPYTRIGTITNEYSDQVLTDFSGDPYGDGCVKHTTRVFGTFRKMAEYLVLERLKEQYQSIFNFEHWTSSCNSFAITVKETWDSDVALFAVILSSIEDVIYFCERYEDYWRSEREWLCHIMSDEERLDLDREICEGLDFARHQLSLRDPEFIAMEREFMKKTV